MDCPLHYVVFCRCGALVAGCRCPAPALVGTVERCAVCRPLEWTTLGVRFEEKIVSDLFCGEPDHA